MQFTGDRPLQLKMVTFVVEHLEEEFYEWCQYGKECFSEGVFELCSVIYFYR